MAGMMRPPTYLVSTFALGALGVVFFACGSSSVSEAPPHEGGGGTASTSSDGSGTGGGQTCAQGDKGCRCYPNGTCNGSLSCTSKNICSQPGVDPGQGGAGGGTGTGSGGGGNAGGGDGGVVGADGGDAGGGGLPDAGGLPCAEPALNCACSQSGALNCLGHAQKGMIMCDGTKWVPNGACSGSLLCDTSPGPNQGTCQQPIAACAGHPSGYSYCSGNSKISCGPDLVSTSSLMCPYVCANGDCTGVCMPGTVSCDGNVPMSCASSAQWLSGNPCPYSCNQGSCCGATVPDVCGTTCVNLQTNNANCGGCGNLCPTTGGKSCQAGVCQCPSGAWDCSGTCVYLNSSSTNCGACGNVCGNGRTCQSAQCACAPGTFECNGTCVNLQTDSLNCGSCGNVCGASTCLSGKCGGTNLVANGDFSAGAQYWGVTSATVGTTAGTSAGSYCVSLPANGTATLGWPDSLNTGMAAPLVGGYSYTFSFTAYSIYSLYSFTAKVGHAISPYTTAFTTSADVLTSAPRTFTHTFTPTYSDTGAGIAFTINAYSSATTVCFDDVSLVRN